MSGISGATLEILRAISAISSPRPAACMSRAMACAVNIDERSRWISASVSRPFAAVECLQGEFHEKLVGRDAALVGGLFDALPLLGGDADVLLDGLDHGLSSNVGPPRGEKRCRIAGDSGGSQSYQIGIGHSGAQVCAPPIWYLRSGHGKRALG